MKKQKGRYKHLMEDEPTNKNIELKNKNQYASTNITIEEPEVQNKDKKNIENIEVDVSGTIFKITTIIMLSIFAAIAIRIISGDYLIEISLALMAIYFIYEFLAKREEFNIIHFSVRLGSLIPGYEILNKWNPFNMDMLSSEYMISNILYLYISFFISTCSFNIYEKIVFGINLFFDSIKTCEHSMGFAKMSFLSLYMIIPLTFITLFSSQYLILNHNIEIAKSFFVVLYLLIMVTPTMPAWVLIYNFLCKKDFKIRDKCLNFAIKNKNKILQLQNDMYKIINKDVYKEKTIIKINPVRKKIDFIVKIFIRYAMLTSLIIYYFCYGNYYFIYSERNKEYCTNLERNDLIVKLENDKVLKLIIDSNRIKSIDDEDCEKTKKKRKVYNPNGMD